jgi:hypothetical protein
MEVREHRSTYELRVSGGVFSGGLPPGSAHGMKEIRATRLWIEDNSKSPLFSVRMACLSTLVAYGLASAIFYVGTLEFARWRSGRTEFAFAALTQNRFAIFLWLLIGTLAIESRRWGIALAIGLVGVLAPPAGGFVWSGPGDLLDHIRPLIDFRFEMSMLARISNWILILAVVMLANPERPR